MENCVASFKFRSESISLELVMLPLQLVFPLEWEENTVLSLVYLGAVRCHGCQCVLIFPSGTSSVLA